MKKFVIGLLVALTLTMMFAVPVLADQPAEPGAFGKAWSNAAQGLEHGISTIIQDVHHQAEVQEVPPGEVINWTLEFIGGIPPAHTP